MDVRYKAEVYTSITEIDPKEWESLVDVNEDLAMDPRLIQLQEQTLSNQAKFWTVLIRDFNKQIVAAACLCLFHADVVQSSAKSIVASIEKIRGYFPQFLKIKVLFCGLPIPCGQSHVRIRNNVDEESVLSELANCMKELASQQEADLLVFKEFGPSHSEKIKKIAHLGYMCGEIEPLYLMPKCFAHFDQYNESLRSMYRKQMQGDIKKFAQTGLQVECFFDSKEISQRFDANIYQLYLNVWRKAKERLECLSEDFFRKIALVFPGQVALVLISDKGKAVAFALGIFEQEVFYCLYIGLDYAYNDSANLYFNLFYQELKMAFPLQKQICLGQTSGMFKTRLGAIAEQRYFWVKPLNPFLKLIFKFFRFLIFPKIKPVIPNQVFKTDPNVPPSPA